MSRLKRGCAMLCVLLVATCALPVFSEDGGAVGSDTDVPVIHISFSVAEAHEPMVLELTEEMNGRWLWMRATDGWPLDSVAVHFMPESEGVLHFLSLDNETPHQLDEEALVDFTHSETMPLAFVVQSLADGDALWTGWLTISHSDRPTDLPDVPVPYVWPDVTDKAEPEPDPLPSPEPEPDPLPSEKPSQSPTMYPATPQPSVYPIWTLEPQPTLFPTLEPMPQPTASPTWESIPQPTGYPTWTFGPQPTLFPTWGPMPQQTASPIWESIPQPTGYPTWRPKPQPTAAPTLMPTQAPQPAPKTGYGVIIASHVNLRGKPEGEIVGQLQSGDVLYISGQAYIGDGGPWHAVTVMDTLQNGFVHDNLLRFMTTKEVNEYLKRPAPKPTENPTPVPSSSLGYARVAWQSAQLRSNPSSNSITIKTLTASNVVYVVGQAVDGFKNLWMLVRTEDGQYGYLLSGALAMMTPTEIAEYLAAQTATLRPTAKPTVSPTLNPNFSYAVVRIDNVNFREAPNGTAIRRVHTGTLARLLSESPEIEGGYGWYRVMIGDEIGYLRTDMVDVIQIRPSKAPLQPTITPTQAPTPMPTPTPRPLPTAGEAGLADKLRAVVDKARYTQFAREQEGPVSFAVRDFDSDKLMELLLTAIDTAPDGAYRLTLQAWKLVDGQVEPQQRLVKTPVLSPGSELQIVLLEQSGREMVYIVQRSIATQSTFGGVGLTLTDSGWVEIALNNHARNPVTLLLASVGDDGKMFLEDYSGLREPDLPPYDAEQERSVLAALYRVVLTLIECLANGNG